jgi:hypothetical protein
MASNNGVSTMIELLGPSYTYNGEILTKPEIIWINDHCFNEEDQCFHVKTLLENSKVDPQLHTLIFDHINHEDELKDYQCVHFPIFLASESQEFLNADIETNWNHKPKTFNFMINKARPHRIFLLQVIEHFKLTNYSHSLPWQDNTIDTARCSNLPKFTDNPTLLNIINGIAKTSAPVTNYKFGPEKTLSKAIINGNFLNAETYKSLLKTNVFEPSCISIVSEPVFFEKEALVTEKTIMAIYGGTFPIWFGGWKCAESMRYLGFDVFDDIIDHSYEDLPNPIERCYYAIERNLHLLTDYNKTKKLADQCYERFQHNLDLLISNVCLEECFAQIDKATPQLRTALMTIMPQFRNEMLETECKDYKIFGSHKKTGLV